MGDRVRVQFAVPDTLLFRYVTNQPLKRNSAFHPPGSIKWVPASAWNWKAKAGMVYSVREWTRGVHVKLWDPLRTRAIPERLRGVFTTRRYTDLRLPYLYLYSFLVWLIVVTLPVYSTAEGDVYGPVVSSDEHV